MALETKLLPEILDSQLFLKGRVGYPVILSQSKKVEYFFRAFTRNKRTEVCEGENFLNVVF